VMSSQVSRSKLSLIEISRHGAAPLSIHGCGLPPSIPPAPLRPQHPTAASRCVEDAVRRLPSRWPSWEHAGAAEATAG
jgi:hypothetical protein